MSKFVEMTFQIAMSVPPYFSSFASQIVQIKKRELPLIKLSKVISEAISFHFYLFYFWVTTIQRVISVPSNTINKRVGLAIKSTTTIIIITKWLELISTVGIGMQAWKVSCPSQKLMAGWSILWTKTVRLNTFQSNGHLLICAKWFHWSLMNIAGD